MTRKQMKELAKNSLSGHWGIAIGAFLLNGIILAAATGVVPGIGGLIIAGPLTVGYLSIFLSLVRAGNPEIGGLFGGFNNFGTNFVAGLLTALYTFLWSLLFVIPGIVKLYSYSMTLYILNDHPEMSPTDAITASRNMMRGHKLDLFVLQLSFIGWLILTAMTGGILSLYVAPYMQATQAAFYEDLKKLNGENA